jgi:hypothetical protein
MRFGARSVPRPFSTMERVWIECIRAIQNEWLECPPLVLIGHASSFSPY